MTKKSFFNFFSLKKDFVLIYRVSMVGIIVTGSLFIKFSIDQEKQKIVEKIFITSQEVEKTISYNADYFKYQLYYTTKQIKDARAYLSDKKMAEILSSFIGDINNQINISVTWNCFSWIDKNNKLSVDGKEGIIKNSVDLSNRDYLSVTSKSPDQLVFGKAINGALSDRLIIPVAIGVFSDHNAYLGTLVFGLDVEKILAKIEKNISNENFSFVVLNNKKIAFTSNNFNKKKLDLAQNFSEKSVENLFHWQSLSISDTGFVGIRSIKNSPLQIAIFYDEKKLHQQLLNIFLQQSFLVLLVIFACVILFQKIYRKIVKPAFDLSQLALKISNKDFAFKIEKPKSKELIDLYDTLNSIKDAFQREEILIEKLQKTNANLALEIKSNAEKSNFLTKSSHDLKNYICAIYGLSKLVLGNQEKSQILHNEDLQMVETISEQSEELLHFVEDLLDTNQIESGEFVLEKIENFCPKMLINRIVLLNKSLAIQHQVSLQTSFEDNLPLLRCDVRRMKQILVNLISNAIKYNKPKSSVKISTKHLASENKICIEIADQGIGMNPKELEMFLAGEGRNIDKSSLQNIDSHGIGMPIVIRLVKLHDGKIEAESQPNVGTKIRLFFNAAPRQEKLAKNTSPQNKKILIAEDNLVNLKITNKILQSAGYQTKTVQNGEEVLKILDEENFDLILMDGEMPIMNGFEAAKKIRNEKLKTIPIIALMGTSEQKLIQKAFDCGMNFYLEKSILKDELIKKIQQILN